MTLKIQMKVNINCQKCVTMVFKSATELIGIDEISVDIEKCIVTVIGDVDPVKVAERIKKTGKVVDIISVGPPKAPEKEKEKEKEKDKCEVIYPWSWAWPTCAPPPPPPAPCSSKGLVCWPV